MEELYEDIKVLDKFYERNIIQLTTYYALKSELIDYYLKLKQESKNEDLPF